MNAAEPAQCNPVVGDNPDPPIGDDVYMSADACPAGSPGIAGIVTGR